MNGMGLALGATTLYGEYGQYNDQFNAGRRWVVRRLRWLLRDQHRSLLQHGQLQQYQFQLHGRWDVFVTGSEVQRWGLGVVQEIDAAAMHVYARWQHQEIDLDLTGITETFHSDGSITFDKQHVGQSFDNWDLFQVGGIIFF